MLLMALINYFGKVLKIPEKNTDTIWMALASQMTQDIFKKRE